MLKIMTDLNKNVEKLGENYEALDHKMRGLKRTVTDVKDGLDDWKEEVLDRIEGIERKQEKLASYIREKKRKVEKNQNIIVFGGNRGTTVEVFNWRQKSWSLLRPVNDSCFDAWAHVYNHSIIAGGFKPSSPVMELTVDPFPDLATRWSEFSSQMPPLAEMTGQGSVLYKDSLFLIGGVNQDQGVYSDCIHEVQLKPPYAVKLVSKMPKVTISPGTVLVDDSIFILGGTKTGYTRDNLDSVLLFDIKTKQCKQLAPLLDTVSEMATVKWGDNIAVIGGLDRFNTELDTVMMYDIESGNSYYLPPMIHKRRGCKAVVIENTIVVIGGMDDMLEDLKSVEYFSFHTNTWQELPEMYEARWLATAVVV